MTTIVLLFLFIMQVVGFYLLALLYTKVSKFDDLENKQRKLMVEMDNSIGAYLSELKDENERLIAKLSVRDKQAGRGNTERENVLGSEDTTVSFGDTPPIFDVNTPRMPINLALKTYNATSAVTGTKFDEPIELAEDDDRTLAFKWHDDGQSIEEIAKKLGKGRTEIELILKFR